MIDELDGIAERIEWDEEIFSRSLSEAVTARQFSRSQQLVGAFAGELRRRERPYPPSHLRRDLSGLRKKRLFTLMRDYVGALIAWRPVTDLQVLRQYGQALIELGRFGEARAVLGSVLEGRDRDPGEGREAEGLIGRSFKQEYVDDPAAPEAGDRLRRAIAAYSTPYQEEPALVWHGINAVSCMQRAVRDRMPWAATDHLSDHARSMAAAILDTLKDRKEPELFDLATRVEALLACGATLEASRALDAYLADARMDAFEVSSTCRQFEQVLQLERHEDATARSILDRLRQAVDRFRAGGVVRRFDRGGARVSALVRVSDPGWRPPDEGVVLHSRMGTVLVVESTREAIRQLLSDPNVISIEESQMVPEPRECDVSVPFVRVSPSYDGPDGPYTELGERALIAIIDEGIDVLHEAFLDETKTRTRIEGVWDQGDPTGPPPEGFSRGTYHSRDAIEKYSKSADVPSGLGRDSMGHGTHVASIAAGQKAGDFAGGVAPGASLLVVIADSNESVGYSRAHLEALDFIDKEATRLDRPVVVNLSQGMNAGAHDGLSALEAGFQHFSLEGRRPGRVIVKSAGNERGKQAHARVTVQPDGLVELPFERSGTASFSREQIELWWSAANDLEFRLGDPGGAFSPWIKRGVPVGSGDLGGTPFDIQFTERHVDNGDGQLVIRLGARGATISPGVWTLQIFGRSVPDDGTVHAWIERGDSVAPTAFRSFGSDDMTLSIPGTAQSVIAVGAVYPKEGAPIVNSSSFGPTRDGRNKPEISAPGFGISAANGGTANGIVKMSGTSMAAPHVAGAIALLLSRAKKKGGLIPTASQISKALLQRTSGYNSRWDPGRGFGVLDVAKFLSAF